MFFLSKALKKSRYLVLVLLIPGCNLLNMPLRSEVSSQIQQIGTSGKLETTKFLTKTKPAAALKSVSPYILVDQFGYRPQDNKVAVIADPQVGRNANNSYVPGDVIEVRRWQDSSVAGSFKPQLWNQGKVQSSSGDRGWWLDFSSIRESGHYYLYDPSTNKRSYPFLIDSEVYYPVLKELGR